MIAFLDGDYTYVDMYIRMYMLIACYMYMHAPPHDLALHVHEAHLHGHDRH